MTATHATAPPPPDTISPSKADEIAALVLEQFNSLPKKRKPTVRDTGAHEWIPLSSIVAERNGQHRCVALATGMKCLPAAKLKEANGNGLHDWHAEILAIRALNHFLLTEARELSSGDGKDTDEELRLLRWTTPADREAQAGMSQPFTIRQDVKLYMYSSEAPCGDASMELTMSAQEDPTPWSVPAPSASDDPQLPGRQYFSHLGIVRRKPSRPDAPPTLSKSCSDKLALAQATSLLSSSAALLINPANAYLSALILPSAVFVPDAFRRCFSDRMGAVSSVTWPGGYRFQAVQPAVTSVEFTFSRREVAQRSGGAVAPCNVSAVWGVQGLEEGLVNGVLQGKKAFTERGASSLSRRRLWELAADVAGLLGEEGVGIRQALAEASYGAMKESQYLAQRREVKGLVREEALKGWVRNVGDDDFVITRNLNT